MKPHFSIEQIRAAAAQRHARQRRLRRILLWTAGTVVVLVLFGFFGLPPIVKSQAQKRLSAQLGREVTIERLRINPLVLSTTIDGLVIKDRDGGPFVAWQRLYVNFDSFSLFTGEWRFQEIVLDAFAGRVAIGQDGKPNFADLLPAPAQPAARKDEEPGRPLYIGRLVVGEARVNFSDASRPQPFATEMGPLTFTLMRFRTAGDPRAPYSFDAATESGERLAWRGTLSIAPVRSAGELTLTGIALKKYAPYYADLVGFELRDGVLDVAGRYEADLSGEKPVMKLAGGTVRLHTLQVAAPGATEPSLVLNELAVEGIDADAARMEATVKRVALDGGYVVARRDAEGIDLLRLITPKTPAGPTAGPVNSSPGTPTPAPTPSATKLPAVKVNEVVVQKFAATVEDHTTPRPAVTKVERLDLSIREFDLADLAHALPVEVNAALAGGGTIKANGTVALQPLAATVALDVQRVALASADPYIEPFLNVRLAKGHASVAGDVRYAKDALTFKGDASIDEFVAVDGARAEDFVSWTSLAVKGISAATAPAPLSLEIAEITWSDPVGRVLVHPDRSMNLNTVLRSAPAETGPAESAPAPKPAAPVPAAAPATPLPKIAVGRVTLQNAGFQFADRSVKPNARLAITGLSGAITGLSSAQLARADIDLRGTVDGSAPVAITGRLNPLGQPAYTDLKIDFRNIELLPIGPYVAKYAGYELNRGALTLDVNFDLAERKITSANIATLDQFTLGARTNSPDATKLPVTLAIALLKDRQGRIVIDLPVQGSLDDPSFRIGRVVMRVITNLLAKAATSPFALLGAMFGGGGEELGFQLFPAGQSALQPGEIKKLDTVAKALRERPALRLDLEGGYDPAADTPVLQRLELERQVRAFVWEERRRVDPATPPPAEITLSPEDREAAIGRMHAAVFGGEWTTTTTGPVQPSAPVAKSPAQSKRPAAPTAGRSGEDQTLLGWLRRVFGRGSQPEASTPPERESAPAVAQPGKPGATPGEAPTPVPTGPTLAEMETKLAERIEITDEALRELATARVQGVKDYLLQQGQIPADRVFSVPPAQKGARVNLQLK